MLPEVWYEPLDFTVCRTESSCVNRRSILDNVEQLTEYSEINSAILRAVGEEFLQFRGGEAGQQSDPL